MPSSIKTMKGGPSSNSTSNVELLQRLLPSEVDSERNHVKNQIVEVLVKDLSVSQIENLIEQEQSSSKNSNKKSIGEGGTTADRGEHQSS